MNNFEVTPVTYDLSWLWSLVGAGVTQLANWFVSRRKEAKELAKVGAEVQSAELDNTEKAITIWRSLAEQMTAQVAEMKAQVANLGEEIAKLKIENINLKSQIEQLREENAVLQAKINK